MTYEVHGYAYNGQYSNLHRHLITRFAGASPQGKPSELNLKGLYIMAKPVLLVVMDGVGFSKTGLGDAVTEANTPTLDWLMANCPNNNHQGC